MKTSIFIVSFLFCFGKAMMTGGKRPQSLAMLNEKVLKDGTTLENLLDVAVKQYNMESNSYFLHVIEDKEDMKIYSQVVEGIDYYIDAKMAPTGCTQRDIGDGGDDLIEKLRGCPVAKENGESKDIVFKIWVRSWKKDPKEMVEISFSNGPMQSLPAK